MGGSEPMRRGPRADGVLGPLWELLALSLGELLGQRLSGTLVTNLGKCGSVRGRETYFS
jgi:hypothetical protein